MSDEEEKDLSPAEQRARKAEKRAAWRQARLKSLEQVLFLRLYSLTFIMYLINVL